MFRNILASIAIYSIVFFSFGQIAFALPQVKLTKNNNAEVKSCPTCSAADAAANPLDKLATLGRRTQNIELLPIARSQTKGLPIEYVSSSTGEVSFAQTDLAFADNPLMLFQRTYLSSRNEDIGLGRGWSFAFNDSIALNKDGAVLTNSAGDNFTYRRAEAKHYVLQPSDSTDVKEFNVENGNTISAKNGGVTRIYKRTSDDYELSRIIAPNGFEVAVNRNSNGRIRSISGIGGEINLDWSSGGNNAKLLAVSDNTGRRISFGQANGALQNATTATGGKWQYQYAGGKISNIINAANRIALRAKYDASGQVSEVGDAVGLNHFAYETNANNISTRTVFTDSFGYARLYQHNERGILTNVSDAEGTLLSIQYNEANQPVQATDVSGTATFEYDAQRRLTRQVLPNGDEKTFEYNAGGKLKATTSNGERTEIVYDEANLTESRIRKNGKNAKSTFNNRGQEIHLQIENGVAVDFEYDGKGHQTAYVYSDIGRFEKTFDAAGRKTSEKMPSGLVHNYEYNAGNQLVRQTDNRGRSARVERDASGNITKIINSDTDSIQIFRDEAGRIVQLTNSRGQSRRYVYNSRGSLIRFIGADGRDLRFQYSERGEMQSIVNAETDGLIYQRKGRGNLAKLQQSTSRKNIWRIQKINYISSFTNAAVEQSCAFGDAFDMGAGLWAADNWFNWGDSVFAVDLSGSSCLDPFGSMGGGGGESCSYCKTRERNNCQTEYRTTLSNNTLALGAGTITCIGLAAATLLIGGVLCQVVASGTVVIANENAANVRDNCLANVASKCESKCN